MATTFTLELGNKPNRSGKYAVYIRITQNRKLKRLKTSIEVKRQSDFNPKAKQDNWIRQSEPNHKKWNEVLTSEIEKAKQVYRELKTDGLATPGMIALTIKDEGNTSSFLQYARERTQQIYKEGGIRNWKKYNGFCNKLQDFLTDNNGRQQDLTFAELSPSLLSKFKDYLHTLHNEREPDKMLHPNTIALNLRIFKTIVNRAIEIDRLIKPEKNPFLSFRYQTVKTTKAKLTDAEIEAIKQLELEDGSRIWDSRNFFLFSYYCAGIRAGDFIQLRWANITPEGRLIYQMGKNHKKRDMILVQPARDILNLYRKADSNPTDYIFPLLSNDEPFAKAVTQEQKDTLSPRLKQKLMEQVSSKTSIINNGLKKIREMAGIEKPLTFHISRHSFSNKAKNMGIADGKIKNILAHSSLKVTENYMGDFDTSETDKVLTSMFEKENPQLEQIKAFLKGLTPEQRRSLLE